MISDTSKENFVKSKSQKKKFKMFETFMMPYSRNPGNGLAELPPIIINLRNKNLSSRTSDLARSWEVRHRLKYAVQFSRHRDNEIHKI